LAAARGVRNCQVLTRGRCTGKVHPVTVWFAVGDDGNVYLETLRMDRDWPKNLRANPEIEIRVGDLRLHGVAGFVTEETKRERIEQALRSKYWVARVGRWFGLKPEGVFEVRLSGEVEARQE
jgi:hypothetical protein